MFVGSKGHSQQSVLSDGFTVESMLVSGDHASISSSLNSLLKQRSQLREQVQVSFLEDDFQ